MQGLRSAAGMHIEEIRLQLFFCVNCETSSKTYEVRSGSLYTKKMGTPVRNMKQVCNRRVGEGINSLPSVKAHPGCCVFAHLYICDCSLDLAAQLRNI